MPIFTGIGLAIGASAATAFAVGVGATAIGAAVGVGAYAAGGGFDSKDGGGDSRVDVGGTGALSSSEARSKSQKRAYRSGILFTSPGGMENAPKTSSAKLR